MWHCNKIIISWNNIKPLWPKAVEWKHLCVRSYNNRLTVKSHNNNVTKTNICIHTLWVKKLCQLIFYNTSKTGGKSNNIYIQHFLENETVKGFWKFVYICPSYDAKSTVLFSETQCTLILVTFYCCCQKWFLHKLIEKLPITS